MPDHSDDLVTELEAIERRRLAALVNGDVAASAALHAEDYQLVTPGGAAMTKAAYLGQIPDGSLRCLHFEPQGQIAVRMLGASAAAVRYQVAIEAVFPGGHDVDRFWHTDIYELRDGQWQVAWSQATRIRGE